MTTADYPILNISFEYNEKTMEIEGFTRLAHVFCSKFSVEQHDEQIEKIAQERNGGTIGKVVKYGSPYTKKEYYAAPELKVFWSSDWE